MTILDAHAALVQRGGAPEHAALVRELRRSFERRAGALTLQSDASDAWFDVRSAAFWDDAIVRAFAARAAGEIEPALATHAPALERAHRGLFRQRDEGILECAVTGAAFHAPCAPFEGFMQGFVCAGSSREIVLLPGVIYHAPEATRAIESLLESAQDMDEDELFDALLRMDRTLRAMPRPKAQLAYRPEALRLRTSG